MEHAKSKGALEFLGKLQDFMRQKQLRAIDLFELVDESGDGYIECYELVNACKRVNMPADDEEARRLFQWLDTSGDGFIGPDELENAIRMYRRFHWENQAIQEHFDSMTRAKYTRESEAHLAYRGASDMRRSSSLQRVVMPGRVEDGVPRVMSLPMVGQQLMGMQDPEQKALSDEQLQMAEGTSGK